MVFHSKVFLNFKIINSTYNTITPAIEWSESEIRALIDIRKKRNENYYRIFGRSKVQFWNEVAGGKYMKHWDLNSRKYNVGRSLSMLLESVR